MKLSQDTTNPVNKQAYEYEQFRRKILNQAAGFGVFYAESASSNHYPSGQISARFADRSASTESPVKATLELIASGVKKAGNQFARYWDSVANRRAITQLLRYSDHLLKDMGLERNDLEHLKTTGGDLEEYINQRRRKLVKSQPASKIIECGTLKGDIHKLHGPEQIKLDHAA